MSNIRQTKAYKNRERVECHFCKHKGRDVTKNKKDKLMCKNCGWKKEIEWGV
jgi:transcription elongation factor Elf1